mmetsp:Transcript_24224/g.27021  ORF Transcript_24224/g.27021 Transcript_24224/m.27021 type:complete len:287 (-) Transcript_24224:413-1273(-)
MKSLMNYLSRIGSPSLLSANNGLLMMNASREMLAKIMEAQSRVIPFENFDIVCGKTISMDPVDVERKLVDEKRGGYCWEQNTLLQLALEDLGYTVQPLLCRVRWGKPDDSVTGPNTGFTHLALKVETDDGQSYLADVGFGGSNSIEPVSLNVGDTPQDLKEGQFRIVPSKHNNSFHVLELQVKEGEWRPLYEWRDEAAPLVDQIGWNWYSCTFPTARFTTQLFACRVVGEERHHILNNQYVIRKGHGINKEVITETITTKARLLELIDQVFGVTLVETEGIDRYLL